MEEGKGAGGNFGRDIGCFDNAVQEYRPEVHPNGQPWEEIGNRPVSLFFSLSPFLPLGAVKAIRSPIQLH